MLWSYSIPYDNSNSAPSRLVSHLFDYKFTSYNFRAQNLPWCNTSPRRFPGEFSQHAICLIENVALLLDGHIHWVLVAVPVQPDLVTSIAHGSHVFGKRFQTVPWDEPGCFDIVLSSIRCCLSRTFDFACLLEHLQESLCADSSSKDSATDIAGAVFSPVRPQPTRNSVDVYAVGNENALLAHRDDLKSEFRRDEFRMHPGVYGACEE